MPSRIPIFLKGYHTLLQHSGGYAFVRKNLAKLIGSIVAVLGLFYAFDAWILDIDSAIKWVTLAFSTPALLGLFFASEVSFGIITPELLIVWADETLKPRWMLFFLASLSYSAGIASYFIGRFLRTRSIIRKRILERHKSTLDQLRNFGGLLIILAALTPLPYPIVCQLCGLNRFPFKYFALLTLVRYLRFGIYGLVLFNLF